MRRQVPGPTLEEIGEARNPGAGKHSPVDDGVKIDLRDKVASRGSGER